MLVKRDLVKESLAAQAEVDAIGAKAIRVAADDTTLFGFPLIVQAWATK